MARQIVEVETEQEQERGLELISVSAEEDDGVFAVEVALEAVGGIGAHTFRLTEEEAEELHVELTAALQAIADAKEVQKW